MTLPFKPHLLALLCSAGLLAAAGTLYVKSREPQTVPEPPAVAQTAQATAAVQPVTTTYTPAQIDQWVAPIALYPDNLLSQVLMASTYPSNVVQAVEWSQDNPTMKGDAAVQAVANQPWDPSVKSLVAFPSLLALMGENAPWVENLGNAFLAQPQAVMDSVQRLRAIAQQTGTLKSTPQQKVITATRSAAPASATSTATASRSSSSAVTSSAPAQVIKIESTNPNVVYVPAYNPSVVYGAWPDTAYPPVYLPPPPGSSLPTASSRGLAIASASPQPTLCSAASTGMMTIITTMTMTITITMMIITAATRTTAITSTSTSIISTILPGRTCRETAPAGSIIRPTAAIFPIRTIRLRSITIRPMFPAALARPNISPPIATRSVRRP